MTNYVAALGDTAHPYHRDAKRLAEQLLTEASMKLGVLRWNSNGGVPPQDVVELADHIGIPVDHAACDSARTADIRAFLQAYRADPPKPDLGEMRAAFGAGARVTNIITGQSWEV